MKFSDKRQLNKAYEEFGQAMVAYFRVLNEIAELEPNKEQLNTLTRQVQKLTNTLERIRSENESLHIYDTDSMEEL